MSSCRLDLNNPRTTVRGIHGQARVCRPDLNNPRTSVREILVVPLTLTLAAHRNIVASPQWTTFTHSIEILLDRF